MCVCKMFAVDYFLDFFMNCLRCKDGEVHLLTSLYTDLLDELRLGQTNDDR